MKSMSASASESVRSRYTGPTERRRGSGRAAARKFACQEPLAQSEQGFAPAPPVGRADGPPELLVPDEKAEHACARRQDNRFDGIAVRNTLKNFGIQDG
jgi:hypothetical protein